MGGEWHLLFKVIIIGDASAGKSCILHQFLDEKFLRNTTHTVGVEFGSKVVEVGGKRIKLWDRAGQERFRAVAKSYYSARADVMRWLADARELASDGIVAVIAGNKCDLKEERQVSFLEGSSLAQDHGLIFLESSALSGESVEELFLKCALRVVNEFEAGTLDLSQISVTHGGGGGGAAGGSKIKLGGDSVAGRCGC